MKNQVRKVLKKFGYDIIKLRPEFKTGRLDIENLKREFKWLTTYNFKTIIDIGSNEGQFSEKMCLLFPMADIFAFEPIPAVYKKLVSNFSDRSNFKAFNIALGENKGFVDFYTNEYSPSSSALIMHKNHTDSFDHAVATEKVTVEISTLDLELKLISKQEPILIKIDVQGYEDKVINGGLNVISSATVVICEVSYVPLYTGQPLFDDIYPMFKSMGFKYAGNIEQLHSTLTNQILQGDAIFIK